jgi:hypothetical protein
LDIVSSLIWAIFYNFLYCFGSFLKSISNFI